MISFNSYIDSVSICVNNYALGVVADRFLRLGPTEAQRQDGAKLTDVQAMIVAKTTLVALSVFLTLSILSPLGIQGAAIGFLLSGLYAFERLVAEQCPAEDTFVKTAITVGNVLQEFSSWLSKS